MAGGVARGRGKVRKAPILSVTAKKGGTLAYRAQVVRNAEGNLHLTTLNLMGKNTRARTNVEPRQVAKHTLQKSHTRIRREIDGGRAVTETNVGESEASEIVEGIAGIDPFGDGLVTRNEAYVVEVGFHEITGPKDRNGWPASGVTLARPSFLPETEAAHNGESWLRFNDGILTLYRATTRTGRALWVPGGFVSPDKRVLEIPEVLEGEDGVTYEIETAGEYEIRNPR